MGNSSIPALLRAGPGYGGSKDECAVQGDTGVQRDAPIASSMLGMRVGELGTGSTAMGLLGACLLLGGSWAGVFGEQTKNGTRALWAPQGGSALALLPAPSCSTAVPAALAAHLAGASPSS